MNLKERNDAIRKIFEDECAPILETKGADYMDQDAFDQFTRLAEKVCATPDRIMFIYMDKHYQAVTRAMSGGEIKGEPLEEKLKDIVNYALIMLAYYKQQGGKECTPQS